MSTGETQKIFDYLYNNFVWSDKSSKLPDLYRTFKDCSYDRDQKRYVVNNLIKTINFDLLTKWYYHNQDAKPQSADSLSFVGNDIFLIEFKAGDQVKLEWNKRRLIKQVTGKIDGSRITFCNKILPSVPVLDIPAVRMRFYLVVDSEAMGIGAQILTLLRYLKGVTSRDITPTGNAKIDIIIEEVLSSLNESTDNINSYNEVDIWFSEAFDMYLHAYGIKDITCFSGLKPVDNFCQIE